MTKSRKTSQMAESDKLGVDTARAGDTELSDEELTALALSADASAPLGADAIPIDLTRGVDNALLPSWYMPPVVTVLQHRAWKPVVLVLVFSFLFIEVAGLCSTYGQLVIP